MHLNRCVIYFLCKLKENNIIKVLANFMIIHHMLKIEIE